jgi:hypothetical protein
MFFLVYFIKAAVKVKFLGLIFKTSQSGFANEPFQRLCEVAIIFPADIIWN